MRRVQTQSLLLRVGKQEEKKASKKRDEMGALAGQPAAFGSKLQWQAAGRRPLSISLPSLSEKAQISAGFQDERR